MMVLERKTKKTTILEKTHLTTYNPLPENLKRTNRERTNLKKDNSGKGTISKRTNLERENLKKDSSGKGNLKKDNPEQETPEKEQIGKGTT